MDITTVKSHIINKSLDGYYIFTGPELGVMDIYIDKIAEILQAKKVRPDDIAQTLRASKSKAFIKTSQISVFRDCKELITNESLQEQIDAFSSNCECYIFIYTNIDKRTKFYKRFKDRIVEFNPMREDIFVKHLQQQIDLPERECKQLAEVCEMDYSRALLEIDKIVTYSQATGTDSLQSYRKLVESGAIYVPPYDAIFDFVDAVLKNKKRLAFQLLQESYDYGEATLVLLTALYNNTKQLLQLQTCKSADISSATGLTYFQIKLATPRKGYNSAGDLVWLMRNIQKTETGIKSGKVADEIAVAKLLVEYWGE